VKAKILLADDDEEVLAALSAALASEGYDVIVAKNGREAIERFREDHVDVALLDLNMPVTGGWEAFERLTIWQPGYPPVRRLRSGLDDPSTAASNRHDGEARSIPTGSCSWNWRIDGKASRLTTTATDDR
jgi:CheY-like chemotaxis protein